MSTPSSALSGLLVVDKPSGPTSHDIVAQARRFYGTRRVGHAGTLDPLASGVLVLLFGEGTKLAPYLSDQSKRYRATVCFGSGTDTLDALGTTTARVALAPDWRPHDLEAILQRERDRQQQIPPTYSALKVAGVRAYRMARRGDAPVLAARSVHVSELSAVDQGQHTLTLEMLVSKGYYVRSLARDLGEQLGVPAHLQALRRLASGPFRIDEACAWPLHPVPKPLALSDAARRALPCATLSTEGALKARRGQLLDAGDFIATPSGGLEHPSAWLLDGEIVAVGSWRDGRPVVRRGFAPG